MGGLPKGSDAKKSVETLCDEFGWVYDPNPSSSSHVAGTLKCSEHSRAGCQIKVYSTGRDTAKAVWNQARKCTHGQAPNRKQW
jgi:hypothetical protein